MDDASAREPKANIGIKRPVNAGADMEEGSRAESWPLKYKSAEAVGSDVMDLIGGESLEVRETVSGPVRSDRYHEKILSEQGGRGSKERFGIQQFQQQSCCVGYVGKMTNSNPLLELSRSQTDDRVVVTKERRVLETHDMLQFTHRNDLKQPIQLEVIPRERIAMVVEECMQRLNQSEGNGNHPPARSIQACEMSDEDINNQRIFRNQFLLRWLIMKILQSILCVIIIILFHHEGSYYKNPEAYLPILVTFYVTLTIILFTQLIHLLCFNFIIIKNPHSLLCIITSALLALVTATGKLVLLIFSGYHEKEVQVIVLCLACVLEMCLLTELYLCYMELKRLWNRIGHSNQ